MEKFKTGIIGVTEPIGAELARLLLGHPVAELTAVSAHTHTNLTLGELYPSLRDICGDAIVSDEEVISRSDIVFCALANSDNQEIAAECIKNKCVFIDLGAAFRLDSDEEYSRWYGGKFVYPGLHEAAVYGLPELMRSDMPGRVVVGCPGAVATAAELALVPLLEQGILSPKGIVIDAKLPAGSYGGSSDGSFVFGVGGFRETAETEQMLSAAAQTSVRVTVAPHIIPSKRGLLVTCYGTGTLAADEKTLRSALERAYGAEPFIRLLSEGVGAATSAVIGSNICDISLSYDARTSSVAVTAALDYFMKGSAGQAVQCMNMLLSMPEGIGVDSLPML